MRASHRKTLMELLTLPTAPFVEQHIIGYIRRWADTRPDIRLTADRFGNIRLDLVRRPNRGRRPLVLCAHMDHPGFEAVQMAEPRRLEAAWRGGVRPDYFPGVGVRFHAGRRWVHGTIKSVTLDDTGLRVQSALIDVPSEVPPGAPGMWDLPDPRAHGDVLKARGCDDVAGVAAILCALDNLHRSARSVKVAALFTRAEEVGFAGAMGACQSEIIPEHSLIVAVETSSELPGVPLGGGPILRVADASAVFTPWLTQWCREVARATATEDRTFRYRCRVMDGGTCESAVYWQAGYEATGLCIPLGNYHNMDVTRGRIASESISLADFAGLVRWFEALAISRQPYDQTALSNRLGTLRKRWLPLLRGTARRALNPTGKD